MVLSNSEVKGVCQEFPEASRLRMLLNESQNDTGVTTSLKLAGEYDPLR